MANPDMGPHYLVAPLGDSLETRIVSAILWDVTDRRGWRQEWDEFDDGIKKEIVAEWVALVHREIWKEAK